MAKNIKNESKKKGGLKRFDLSLVPFRTAHDLAPKNDEKTELILSIATALYFLTPSTKENNSTWKNNSLTEGINRTL